MGGKDLRILGVVQARLGSTRFLGKMVADLGGRPLLEWVVGRASLSRHLDQVVLATTNREEDDALEILVERMGVDAYRGPVDDVVGRILAAAEPSKPDLIVRICGDNPFVDPGIVDDLIVSYRRDPRKYGFNHQSMFGSGHSNGFGAEIIQFDYLSFLYRRSNNAMEKEHMTQLVLSHTEEDEIMFSPPRPAVDRPELRFDVDVEEDLAMLRELVQAGVNFSSDAREILEIFNERYSVD